MLFFISLHEISGSDFIRKITHVTSTVFMKKYNIAVAGTGYVGLSLATLLSQHNHVVAVDVISDKVEKINSRISPIQDDYIEKLVG